MDHSAAWVGVGLVAIGVGLMLWLQRRIRRRREDAPLTERWRLEQGYTRDGDHNW
jgi:hypothetical protein